ncbi:TraB/GumN family protein [Duganella sp. Root336D2]|uniref:TraB/GumN family protein n=1 Tax=Duganella sp. Root336D2 TaxID=1736518 RepID=UPI0006FD3F71|nr:TraB/GumN family protein [Duganella sp. Root336D2]KQV51373.1 hypothetical protein ASD07_10790 [Duganella sp. Root336D2]
MYFELPGTNVRIMGSMHMLPPNAGLPTWADRAFDWCEELMFEGDPMAILPHLRSTAGIVLNDHLSVSTWGKLKNVWRESEHIPPLAQVQPWAAFLLSSSFASPAAPGVEPIFLKRAAEQSKPVQFFETGADLNAALEKAPLEDVIGAIESLADDLTAPQRNVEEMYRAWIAGDLPSLYAVAAKSPAFAFAGMRKAVLQNRNEAWVPILQNRINTSKRVLIAIGALHLYGPGNLLELLGHEFNAVAC